MCKIVIPEVTMSILVQKYGGSSVSDIDRIRKVAAKVKARREAGDQLVVVVSAMGDTTDELLGLAKAISSDPPRRELDMLLTCGERISMALLSMALHEMGVPAISFTGSQSGIITTDAHAQAEIIEVRPVRILEELAKSKVVIVAGYQGVSRKREVTTLGRGGSDTTAVALAAALDASCEIYSDVDGICSADPRQIADARRLDEISYAEMQELSSAGAKVLNAQAVDFARAKGIEIRARYNQGEGGGTAIRDVPVESDASVKAVTSDLEIAVLTSDLHAQAFPELLDVLDQRAVRGRLLTFESVGPARGAMIVIPLQDVHGFDVIKRELSAQFGDRIFINESLGSVTCVGGGILSDWSILRKAMDVADSAGIGIVGTHCSSLQFSFLAPRANIPLLVQHLHRVLVSERRSTETE